MKIDVITMQCIRNYGSVLQTYATQKKLEDAGFDVEIINYYRKDSVSPKASVETYLADNPKWNSSFIKRLVYRIWKTPVHKRQFEVFGDFLKKYINLTTNMYFSNEELLVNCPKADWYCVGSDQMWNTDYNKGIEEAYYLSFVPQGEKCFAFSTSIGKDSLSQTEAVELKTRINKFNLISVRERSAQEILTGMGLKNVEHILDPTLMLPKEQWMKFVQPRSERRKYVLIYQLNKNSNFDVIAEKFARERQLELLRINLVPENRGLPGKSIYLPSVEEFVSLFYYAEYIITDSFHGTSFCVNFQKNFAIVKPEKFFTRIESVLNLLGLEERVINSYSELEHLDYDIEYDQAIKTLCKERKKVDSFINKLRM